MIFDEADAFVALPGGFGTLDELLEMVRRREIEGFLFFFIVLYSLSTLDRKA
jgi:predicted Rossmann-fold nucleotide-binding protein